MLENSAKQNLFTKKDLLDVSIGIVAYSTSESIIDKTLASIKNFANVKNVYVLCNSPLKKYQEQIKNLCDKYSFVFISSYENLGFGMGHNTIFKQVNTKWYICCNPDVIINNNTIPNLIQGAEDYSDSVLIMPKILNKDGSIQPVVREHITLFNLFYRQIWRIFPFFTKPFEKGFNYDCSQKIQFASGCFFLIRSEHYRLLHGFSSSFFLYCEDADISKRAEYYGSNYYISNSSVTHLWAKGSSKSFKLFFIQIKSLFIYFSKYGYF